MKGHGQVVLAMATSLVVLIRSSSYAEDEVEAPPWSRRCAPAEPLEELVGPRPGRVRYTLDVRAGSPLCFQKAGGGRNHPLLAIELLSVEADLPVLSRYQFALPHLSSRCYCKCVTPGLMALQGRRHQCEMPAATHDDVEDLPGFKVQQVQSQATGGEVSHCPDAEAHETHGQLGTEVACCWTRFNHTSVWAALRLGRVSFVATWKVVLNAGNGAGEESLFRTLLRPSGQPATSRWWVKSGDGGGDGWQVEISWHHLQDLPDVVDDQGWVLYNIPAENFWVPVHRSSVNRANEWDPTKYGWYRPSYVPGGVNMSDPEVLLRHIQVKIRSCRDQDVQILFHGVASDSSHPGMARPSVQGLKLRQGWSSLTMATDPGHSHRVDIRLDSISNNENNKTFLRIVRGRDPVSFRLVNASLILRSRSGSAPFFGHDLHRLALLRLWLSGVSCRFRQHLQVAGTVTSASNISELFRAASIGSCNDDDHHEEGPFRVEAWLSGRFGQEPWVKVCVFHRARPQMDVDDGQPSGLDQQCTHEVGVLSEAVPDEYVAPYHGVTRVRASPLPRPPDPAISVWKHLLRALDLQGAWIRDNFVWPNSLFAGIKLAAGFFVICVLLRFASCLTCCNFRCKDRQHHHQRHPANC